MTCVYHDLCYPLHRETVIQSCMCTKPFNDQNYNNIVDVCVCISVVCVCERFKAHLCCRQELVTCQVGTSVAQPFTCALIVPKQRLR